MEKVKEYTNEEFINEESNLEVVEDNIKILTEAIKNLAEATKLIYEKQTELAKIVKNLKEIVDLQLSLNDKIVKYLAK